jgi:hypothetical protein
MIYHSYFSTLFRQGHHRRPSANPLLSVEALMDIVRLLFGQIRVHQQMSGENHGCWPLNRVFGPETQR